MKLQGKMDMKNRQPSLMLVPLRLCVFYSLKSTTSNCRWEHHHSRSNWAAELMQNLSWRGYEAIRAQGQLLSATREVWAWIAWSKEELEWGDQFH